MSIVLEQLSKRYAGQVIVDRVSLEIADRELFVLLGTSGSGKSTILRLIAGLVNPDSGRILLKGRDVTSLAPQQRGTGFVFQNYSIFRHMSVAANIEFGLKIRNVVARDRAQKRDELLEIVGMAGLGNRYASQLSGGQLQRVALARALAYAPEVLLLDEPFGALDVKTRSQLRRSLKDVQRQLGVTTLLVTHDQDEAFELADRIGVLDRGKLLEVGEPERLYAEPRTLFAATFVGAGTVLVGKAERERARFGALVLPIPAAIPHEDGAPVQVLFRPEQVRLSEEPPTDGAVVIGQGRVIEQSFTGAQRRVRVKLARLAGTRQVAPALPFGEECLLVDAVVAAGVRVAERELWLSVTGWHILQQPEPQLLVFDDVSGSTATITLARNMVEQMAASVTVLGVADSSDEVEAQRATLLARQLQLGVTGAHVRVRTGSTVEQILTEQNESLYSIVVLAPHARQPFDHASVPSEARRRVRRQNRLGPTVTKLLQRTPLPVVVVKSERARIQRMLICTAAGEPGKTSVLMGGRLARRLNAHVTLLYVTGESTDCSRWERAHLEHAASTLRALDVPISIRIRPARSPAKGILVESREGDHDLIVMGHHGPSSRSLFGHDDVMLQVLVGADRPVMVVPADAMG